MFANQYETQFIELTGHLVVNRKYELFHKLDPVIVQLVIIMLRVVQSIDLILYVGTTIFSQNYSMVISMSLDGIINIPRFIEISHLI